MSIIHKLGNTQEMMKSFKKDGKFGKKPFGRPDRPSSGGGFSRPSGGRPAFDKQMHPAVCDECGTNCEVPFKPTGGKPIYCRDCFRKMEGQEERAPSRPGQFRPGRFSGPSRPDSFRRPEAAAGASPEMFKKELAQINAKLDLILKALEDGEIEEIEDDEE